MESGDRPVVGVNRFVDPERSPVDIHRHLEEAAEREIAALRRLRAERDGHAVAGALGDLRAAAHDRVNLVPVLIDTVRTYATTGEICGVLREVFGEYRAGQIY